MKKSNLRLLAFFLFLVLAQNSLAATHQDGTGSEAASDETVAVGLSYTDDDGTVHKNLAGNPAKPGEKYYATAIGIANTANKKFSSAFGYLNTATGDRSSAFGYNNITYGKENSAFGYRNRTVGEGSSAFGYWNEARGDRSSAVGFINEASGFCSSAFGYNNTASGYSSSAFGYLNTASGYSSSAFGHMNKAKEESSSAFGYLNEASGKWSNAFGSLYKVTGEASGAFGVGEVDDYVHYNHKYINEGKNSYMFGNYNKIAAGTQNNFILGNNVSIANGISNSVVLGNGSTVSSSNEVSVGSKGKERKITNVGDGEISNSSTDAVNGRQLYSGEGIDTAAWKAKLGVGSGGGGGGIDAYTKNEADNKFANKTDLNDYTKKDDYRDANGIDVDKWKAKLGTGASSTDIQNLRNEVYEKIDNVKNEVRNVGSLSAALAGLHPMQYDPKAPAQVMAALGHYKNKQAIAVGASYHFNDKFMVSTGIALSGEKRTETMANVGFTVKLGKGSGVSYNETPQYVVQNEVKRLTVENQDLKSKINNQDNRIKEQDEKIKNLEEKLNRLLKIK
ncbi:YadA-like family protein [Fusobacterium nucleatum]|nr:YadA-like family protein [Fusobacterium nucleatum]WDA46436.1 YadA-like family protein [Fusobacterium nucleatum]